ncbi:hypothetical protein D3C71_1029890 [compost metagenome]
MNDFFLLGEQASELFFNASQSADQPFILCMLFEVAAHKIQRLMSLGSFFLLFEPGFFVYINLCRILLTALITFRKSFFLIGKFLIEGANLLQCRRGRFQLFFGPSGLLLSRFQCLGVFLGGAFQSRKSLFLSFQRCSVIRLLFAGGGERCVCTVQ